MQSKNLFVLFATVSVLGIMFLGVMFFPMPFHFSYHDTFLRSDHVLSNQTEHYPIVTTRLEAIQGIASLGEVRFDLPVHITIEKIHVDAPLETVGFTEKGEVDIPKGPMNPAWFKESPRPGEIGNAIVVGHFGWKDNIPAVFDDLDQLTKGDKISVRDEQGIVQTFVVRETRTYRQNETAPDVFISRDGKAHLNLITCSGIWDKAIKSYSTRLIVFTDKE